MKYIDAHCHIPFDVYDDDRTGVLARMEENDTGGIVVGVDLKSSKEAVAFAEGKENIWATIGLHPNYTEEEIFDTEAFTELVQHPKVVGVGECGLDYYRVTDPFLHEKQKEAFELQIQFALQHDLPLMIHARPRPGTVDAYQDLIDILRIHKQEAGERLRGNVHFFVGGVPEMEQLTTLGFSVSVTGVITFAADYDAVVQQVPKDMLLSETDSPYATPNPHRGKRNEPAYVEHVVARIAELWDMNEEDTARQLVENAQRVFKLD